jgi:hypothetical protein
MFSELMDSFTDKDKKGHTRLTFREQFFFWIHLQNKVPKLIHYITKKKELGNNQKIY